MKKECAVVQDLLVLYEDDVFLFFSPGQIGILPDLAKPGFKLAFSFESVYISQSSVKRFLCQFFRKLRIAAH